MDVRFVDAEGAHPHESDDVVELLCRDDGFVWVDVPAWDEQVDSFLQGLGCHPLVIEACRTRNHVPTVHSYADHYFVTVHSPLLGRAGHASCGLLLDAYHLGRSGATLKNVEDVAPSEIVYVQFSDPPRTGLEPGKALDRLPPGQGSFWFREFFALIARSGYEGYCSYEAPNPGAWARDPLTVAREALAATHAVLP